MNMTMTTASSTTPSSLSPSSTNKDPATVTASGGEEDPAAAPPADPAKNSNSNIPKKGVAGRIDYAQWDRVANDLCEDHDNQEQQEIEKAKAELGLGGKYARSASEAEEREKASKVQQAKKQIDEYKKREKAVMKEFVGLLGPVVKEEDEGEGQDASNTKPTIRRITRNDLEAGKRVMTLSDTTGKSPSRGDTIVLTQDLTLLESQIGTNPLKKTYEEDAENAVQEQPAEQQQPRSVFGLIKLFIRNVHNCTIVIKCKMISGTVEFHDCSNVTIQMESTTTVATVQGDLSKNMTLEFRDAPSGKNTSPNEHNKMYWGDDEADDRIFHAGVSNMTIRRIRNDIVEAETVVDYIKDGATAVGNATAEEMQFITSMLLNKEKSELEFVTAKAVRSGQSTGKNARAMTQRELDKSNALREKIKQHAIAKAEEMIQIKDKNGNVIVKKTTKVADDKDKKENGGNDDVVVEEVLSNEIKDIVEECQEHKAKGNEAFGTGEYGQAILLYSLALDKAAELPSDDDDKNKASLFPLDVVYSNRAACFLKLGQHDKALEDANEACALSQDGNCKALFRAGLALHAMGQYQTALPRLATAHKMQPKNAQIKQALQFCEVRLEQERRKQSQG